MTGEQLHVIGIDPGPTPGFVLLYRTYSGALQADAAQCSARLAPVVLDGLLQCAGTHPVIVQIEQFVIGRRSGRSSSAKAGQQTRDLVGQLQQVCEQHATITRRSHPVLLANASRVKHWATDARLLKTQLTGDRSLFTLTAGMRHARDAARHALFAAVHDGGIPDPLSKQSRGAPA